MATVPIDPAERPNWDLVDADGPRVIDYVMKPGRTALSRGVALALWRPPLSRFLIDWLAEPHGARAIDGEASLGHFVRAVLASGFVVHESHAGDGLALDVGVPERLARAGGLGALR